MPSGVTCVVPARLGSTRFFGKLLTPLLGKPVVVHALERAAAAGCFNHIVCFTDSPEIGAAVLEHGFDRVLTGEAANGTERIARHLHLLGGDETGLIVNLQGDEPAFPEEGLRILCAAIQQEPGAVHILVHAEAPTADELANPNRVKVALDADGFVTDFVRRPSGTSTGSVTDVRGVIRTPVPEPVEGPGVQYRLQLGAYGYSRAYLEQYAALPPSAAELELSHELLRAPGLAPLRAHLARPGASVDVPADLETALTALNALNASPGKSAPEKKPASSPVERQPRLQGSPA